MGEKWNMGAVDRKESWLQRKPRESRVHRDKYEENNFPKPLAVRMNGAEFCEILQPGG